MKIRLYGRPLALPELRSCLMSPAQWAPRRSPPPFRGLEGRPQSICHSQEYASGVQGAPFHEASTPFGSSASSRSLTIPPPLQSVNVH